MSLSLLASWGCSTDDPKAEGEECFASSECAAGLTCDFGQSPSICAGGQSGGQIDAAVDVVDADTTQPDADEDSPDAMPGTPDAAIPDAALPDADTPDAEVPDADMPDAE